MFTIFAVIWPDQRVKWPDINYHRFWYFHWFLLFKWVSDPIAYFFEVLPRALKQLKTSLNNNVEFDATFFVCLKPFVHLQMNCVILHLRQKSNRKWRAKQTHFDWACFFHFKSILNNIFVYISCIFRAQLCYSPVGLKFLLKMKSSFETRQFQLWLNDIDQLTTLFDVTQNYNKFFYYNIIRKCMRKSDKWRNEMKNWQIPIVRFSDNWNARELNRQKKCFIESSRLLYTNAISMPNRDIYVNLHFKSGTKQMYWHVCEWSV